MSLLAHVFEEDNALQRLELFASRNGPAFYRLPVNEQTMTLVKHDQAVKFPSGFDTDAGHVTVFDPGFETFWHPEID